MILKVQRMRNAPKLPCLAWGILMLAMLAFAPRLCAQQPSVELSELRETTNAGTRKSTRPAYPNCAPRSRFTTPSVAWSGR